MSPPHLWNIGPHRSYLATAPMEHWSAYNRPVGTAGPVCSRTAAPDWRPIWVYKWLFDGRLDGTWGQVGRPARQGDAPAGRCSGWESLRLGDAAGCRLRQARLLGDGWEAAGGGSAHDMAAEQVGGGEQAALG